MNFKSLENLAKEKTNAEKELQEINLYLNGLVPKMLNKHSKELNVDDLIRALEIKTNGEMQLPSKRKVKRSKAPQ